MFFIFNYIKRKLPVNPAKTALCQKKGWHAFCPAKKILRIPEYGQKMPASTKTAAMPGWQSFGNSQLSTSYLKLSNT